MLCALVPPTREDLAQALVETRERTLALAQDVDEATELGPCLPIINCALWEFGHVGWFQERWILRRGGAPPMRDLADAWYDSSAIPHGERWGLPMPTWEATLDDLQVLLGRSLEVLETEPFDEESAYFAALCVFHEDMHQEAFVWTRQVLGRAAPAESIGGSFEVQGDGGDVSFSAGTVHLGCRPDGGFVFDNEQGCHPVELAPFTLAREPVTELEFAAFVDAGGYREQGLWSEEGWAWREHEKITAPLYWVRTGGGWRRRVFNGQRPLGRGRPMIHVSAHEAEAYCRWAGRRLPTEAEWEAAARGYGPEPRRFPWGDEAPGPERAHLDLRASDTAGVGAFPAGDSPEGVRQLIGNVWEWTSSRFQAYPGFVAGAYAEYSEPWFGTHRVLRGGSWATRGRLVHGGHRNYFLPERRDLLVGFRTCGG